MKKTIYRIVINNLSPENVDGFVQILKNEFNYSRVDAEKFITFLPRTLYKTTNVNNLKRALNVIKKGDVNLSVQKLVNKDNLPIYIDNEQYLIISKTVSMTLRSGSDMIFVYMVAEPEGDIESTVSLLGRGKSIEKSFRLSDFVFVIDEKTILFLGFSTDNTGAKFVISKLTKKIQAIVGKNAKIRYGHAVMPKDGYSFSDVLQKAKKRLDKNHGLLNTAKSIPCAKKNDTLQLSHNAMELCTSDNYFQFARGAFLQKLTVLAPETVWAGLKNMTPKSQKRFLLRLPHNSKLTTYLSENIKKQPEVEDEESAKKQISHLLETIEIDKSLAQRKKNKLTAIELLNQATSLPVIPEVALQVYNLTIKPESTVDDIEKIISTDQGLTLKILKMVNSPFYGMANKVDSIKEGIVILGMEEVAQLAFGLSLSNPFSGVGIKEIIDPVLLRRHAVEVAITGMFLCNELEGDEFNTIFTACILHDVGRLFFMENFPELYKRVALDAQTLHLPLYLLEEELFGFNHGNVGSIIAKKWNLPTSLYEAIAFHHNPSIAPKFKKLAAIVGFADCLCHMPQPHENNSDVKHLVDWSMNRSLTEVLQNIYGDISNATLIDLKTKTSQVLEENENLLDLITN